MSYPIDLSCEASSATFGLTTVLSSWPKPSENGCRRLGQGRAEPGYATKLLNSEVFYSLKEAEITVLILR